MFGPPHFQVTEGPALGVGGGGYLKLEIFLNGLLSEVGSCSVCPTSR